MSKKKRVTRVRKSSDPDIIVVPVSGGKDSQKVLSDAKREYGPGRIRAIHNFTGIDHPLTMRHLDYMQELYGVTIEHTVNPRYRDMWDLLDKKNMIPGRIARFCTDELKIQATNHWLAQFSRAELRRMVFLMGMRTGESQKRAASYAGFSPDVSTGQVFDSLRERGEQVNPLYARGHTRVGCYPCILSGKGDYRMASRDPVGRETIVTLRDFKALLAERWKGTHEPEVIIPHDLDEILDARDADPFGFHEEDDGPGCSWCAM